MKLKELMQVKESKWAPDDESYPLSQMTYKKGGSLYVTNLPMSMEDNKVYKVVVTKNGIFLATIKGNPKWLSELIDYALKHMDEVPSK